MINKWYIPAEGQENAEDRRIALGCDEYGVISPWQTQAAADNFTELPAILICYAQSVCAVLADDGTITRDDVATAASPYISQYQ